MGARHEGHRRHAFAIEKERERTEINGLPAESGIFTIWNHERRPIVVLAERAQARQGTYGLESCHPLGSREEQWKRNITATTSVFAVSSKESQTLQAAPVLEICD